VDGHDGREGRRDWDWVWVWVWQCSSRKVNELGGEW
jgi:hypothetical protein